MQIAFLESHPDLSGTNELMEHNQESWVTNEKYLFHEVDTGLLLMAWCYLVWYHLQAQKRPHPGAAYIYGLVQDFSISFANTLEILQSCTKPSIYRAGICSAKNFGNSKCHNGVRFYIIIIIFQLYFFFVKNVCDMYSCMVNVSSRSYKDDKMAPRNSTETGMNTRRVSVRWLGSSG